MKILPDLKLTWTGETRELEAGKDYVYNLIKTSSDKVSAGNALYAKDNPRVYAVMEITFRGHYGDVKSLRITYTIDRKTMKQKVGTERDKVYIDVPNSDFTDDAYHYEYDGLPHQPTIGENGVTYKGVKLKLWTDPTSNGSWPTPNEITKTDDIKKYWYDDWYTVTPPAIRASENDEESDSRRTDDGRGEGHYHYTMTVTGYGNYTDSYTYPYVIDQREVKEGDVTGLNDCTFYFELDEDKIEDRIKKSLVNNLEKKELVTTDGDLGSNKGYVIYYYKIVNGKEILFTAENFPEMSNWGAADGTVAPADPNKMLLGRRIRVSERAAVEALEGEYVYRIGFTGNGNFKENLKDAASSKSPIMGRFWISEEEPHLADVYKSLKKDLLVAINDELDPTYDATDWFEREGGSYTNPNDVKEIIKREFNKYVYNKRDPRTGAIIPCRAGDNIEISLHPKHNGKMIDAGDYIIRISGTGDWKDDLDGDGYIYMDGVKVDQRHLDGDDTNDRATVPVADFVDYTGNRTSEMGDYVDRFYIKNGAWEEGSNAHPEQVEQYAERTDSYKNGDIYKYGAVQYLTTYNGSSYGDPMITITHLVRDTEDTEKEYPLAVNQSSLDLFVGEYADNGNIIYPKNVRAREKELTPEEDFHYVKLESSYAILEGQGNYTGRIKVPVIKRAMINLADKDAVSIRIKSLDEPDEKYNTKELVVKRSLEEGGVNLWYDRGSGVDLLPNNVEVRLNNDLVPPEAYRIVIDQRNANGMICQNCRDIPEVGGGSHVHVGLHRVLVVPSGNARAAGFQEAEFYIRSNLKFSDHYKAIWDEELKEEKGYKDPVADQPVAKEMAPHNFVKVVSSGSDRVVLNQGEEYEYECYIPEEYLNDFKNGKLEADAKYKMNVRDGVEFKKDGTWYLVIKPINTKKAGVEEYEDYLYIDFMVGQKAFDNTEKGGKIKAEVKNEYKNGISWPGHAVTGSEIGKMLRVEDAGGIVDTELEYGKDYTIVEGDSVNEVPITTIGTHTVTLKGIGSYTGTFEIGGIIVNKASLTDARIEIADGKLIYKDAPLPYEVDKDSMKIKVTVVTADNTEDVVDPEEYTVTAASKDGSNTVGTKVTITVGAKTEGHYEGTVKQIETKPVEATISKANINTEIFKLTGLPEEVVFKGVAEEPELKLTDLRTGKEVGIDVKYEGNDKVGEATVTVTPKDTENYEGAIPGTFMIISREFAVELKSGPFPYKGKGKAYTATEVIAAVYDKNGEAVPEGGYTAVMKNAENAGTAAVVVTIPGNDTPIEKKFTIDPLPITSVTGIAAEYTYNGTVIRPKVTVMADREILQNDNYVIYNTEKTEVGEKELIVVGVGNYTGTIKNTFNVVPASIEGASVTGVKASYKYNGTARQPKVKVTLNGKVLKRDVDYKVTYSADSTAVGGKTATIEGTGNYTGSQVKAYSVVPAKAVVKSVKAGKKRQLTVKVNAQAGVTYQIQYKVSGDSTWSSAKATGTKKVLKHLTSGKKYDIRVRAFATIDGARVNGAWSKMMVKKVK